VKAVGKEVHKMTVTRRKAKSPQPRIANLSKKNCPVNCGVKTWKRESRTRQESDEEETAESGKKDLTREGTRGRRDD